MTDHEFITQVLDIEQPMPDDPNRFSTIALLLKGARKLFGCDLKTGQYVMDELNDENLLEGTYRSFQLTAIINYLIFLEQVGSIFKPNDAAEPSQTNGIFRALKFFSSLQDDTKINAIVSLRNSLAHKYGLATEKEPRTKPPRQFILTSTRDADIIKLPANDWDGTFSDKSQSTYTTIHVIDLVIEIEKTYQHIRNEYAQGNLILALNDGISELKARYTLTN